MAKTYWICVYHAIHDESKLAAYAKLAAPAVQSAVVNFWPEVPQLKLMKPDSKSAQC